MMFSNLLAQNEQTDFGLETIQSQRGGGDPAAILQDENFSLAVLLLILLGILVVIAFIFRFLGRRFYNRFNPFEMITLRVLLSKESAEVEDTRRQQQKLEPRQQIAPVESLMANLAGLRAERGPVAWFLGRRDHFAFEIVANEGVISFYATVPADLRRYVEEQIQAQFPNAFIEEKQDYNIFTPACVAVGAVLKFNKSYFFPIRTYQHMDADPLNALTNSLSKFRDPALGGAAIQYVMRSAHPRWHAAGNNLAREVRQGKKLSVAVKNVSGSILMTAFRALAKRYEKEKMETQKFAGLSQFEEEAVARIQEKSSKSGFEVNIRVAVAAPTMLAAESQLAGIIDSFSQYSGYQFGNSFKKTRPRRLDKFLNDFIYRNFNERNQIIVNTEEAASLFHFPLPRTETPNILWLEAKQASAPVNMPLEGLVLGHNIYRGADVKVRLKDEDRRRHVYIIGKSGSGKSVLISNMASQDMQSGKGLCVIDPHGDLVDYLLSQVPPERLEDVIYFDPGNMNRPMGLNMLEYKSDDQKDFAVQEMIAIFMKLFPPEVIGPMFEHNMRNVMLTLMADKEHPGTIVDIPRMFTDTEYQKYKVGKLTDPNVLSFWQGEMAKTSDFHKSEMLGYLISKVGRFVENEMMRNIIGQPKSAFDLRDVMDNKKILLINLAKGRVGEVNSALLGLIIVSKLQMAAMARANLPEEERHDFYLYIDEFQNFVTDSIATILSEARKYRLDLIIAHQYVGQLVQGQDTKIRDAVFGNVGTMVSFKIGVEDAEIIAKEFAPVFNEYDVINIPKYHAYVKLLIDNTASKPFQMQTYPSAPSDFSKLAKLKEYTSLKYGVDRQLVEKDILDRMRLGQLTDALNKATPGESLR